ncbi:hypothetical protein LCGC14_1875630 [marine sediment metagenome]|uniref:RNA polymerase sigma factor n=1 Tax=marine sediment metagenome TaxID=412755 RepID=A0A0F9G3Q5_9ZZZZ
MADRDDFDNLAMEHLTAVYRAAIALCGRADEAEDLVQATYLKALERFDSFQPGTNCRAWLMRILRNTRIDRLRRRKVAGPALPLQEDLLAEPAPHPEPAWTDARDILENFADEEVIRALGELPEAHRLTLFLIDVAELSQAEVAEITDVAVGTVKSRTSRARATLKEALQAHAKDLGLGGREP